MRAKVVTAILIAVAASYWPQATAGQVQPVPGFGTGKVTVQGEVDVRKMPPIDVLQRGEWKVSVANVADVRVVNTPTVAIALPPFVRMGGRYEVTWPAGDRETFSIAQVGGGTWVRAGGEGGARWLNLAAARTIQELP